MATFFRTTLLATCLLGFLGCASAPKQRAFKPIEDGDDKLPPKPAVTAPSAPADPPADADPAVAAPAPSAAECIDKTDCKFKGAPGKGMRWACTEGQCVAEPKRRRHRQ